MNAYCFGQKADHGSKCFCGAKATHHIYYGSGCGNVCAKHKNSIGRTKRGAVLVEPLKAVQP